MKKNLKNFIRLFLPIVLFLGISYVLTQYFDGIVLQIGAIIVLSLLLTLLILKSFRAGVSKKILDYMADINDINFTWLEEMNLEEGSDKLYKLYREIRENLRTQVEISTEIFNTCEELGFLATDSLASAELVATSVDVADNNATEQSQMLRQTNDLANRVYTALDTIDKDIRDKIKFISDSITSAQQGIEKFDDIEERIKNSMDMVLDNSKKITDLRNYSNEVVSLVDLINTISSQTKLLSLNASIEAARAGEHGRGFSIVAMEVGKLAGETEQVSKKIEEVVHGLMDEIQSISYSMEREVEYMDENYAVIEDTNKDFNAILDILNSSMDSLEGITEMAGENNYLIEEINSNITSISKFAEETSAQMMQTANQTMEQYKRSQELSNIVENIRNNVYGMQQFVVGKAMEERMLNQARELRDILKAQPVINDKIINEAAEHLGVDAIYVANEFGVVEYTNVESAMGLELYKAEPQFMDLKRKNLEYMVTPIKKRVEDGRLFKFLILMDETEKLYEVGLSLDSMIKVI